MRRSTKLNIGLLAGTVVAFGAGGGLLAVAAGGGSGANGRPLRASAEIAGPPGSGISGEVRFLQTDTTENLPEPGVRVVARVRGLAPGLHGFHIHENGVCDPTTTPRYSSSGGHFDPGPNGNSNPDVNHPFHMGDLPNLSVNRAGFGHLNTSTSRITLSPGPLTVFDGNGSSVIVHLNPDLGIPGASGSGVSGGPRLACGVIHSE